MTNRNDLRAQINAAAERAIEAQLAEAAKQASEGANRRIIQESQQEVAQKTRMLTEGQIADQIARSHALEAKNAEEVRVLLEELEKLASPLLATLPGLTKELQSHAEEQRRLVDTIWTLVESIELPNVDQERARLMSIYNLPTRVERELSEGMRAKTNEQLSQMQKVMTPDDALYLFLARAGHDDRAYRVRQALLYIFLGQLVNVSPDWQPEKRVYIR